MSGDSPDEFPNEILGGSPVDEDHGDSDIDEGSWTEEFDVGSNQEISSSATASFFSRVLAYFGGGLVHDSTPSGSLDFQAEADEVFGRLQPIDPKLQSARGVAGESLTRIIEVKAIGGGIAEPPTTPRRIAEQDFEATPRYAPEPVSAGISDSGMAANAAMPLEPNGPAGSEAIVQPGLEEFTAEKDDFLIAKSTKSPILSALPEPVFIVVELLLGFLQRIGIRRRPSHDDEIEVASKWFQLGWGLPNLWRSRSVEPDEETFSTARRSNIFGLLKLPLELVGGLFHRLGLRRGRVQDDEIEVASSWFLRGWGLPALLRPRRSARNDFASGKTELAPAESPAETDLAGPDDFMIRSGNLRKTIDLGPDIQVEDPDRSSLAFDSTGTADEFEVAGGANRRRAMFQPDADAGNQASADATSGNLDSAFDTSAGGTDEIVPYRNPTIFADRFENLIDYKGREGDAAITDKSVAAGAPIVSDSQQKLRNAKNLGRILVRLVKWLLTIPKRCVLADGDLVDQDRPRIEPMIAAVPALFMIAVGILAVDALGSIDKIASANRFFQASRKYQAAGDMVGASLAATRACVERQTPENQFEYARLKAQSSEMEVAVLGMRLIRVLASPQGGNQPDAHLFIADEIYRKMIKSPESQRLNLPYYLAELRAGFEASPDRFDILERLVEGLSEIGEEQSLSGLVTPYLDYWPNGHFFLSQAAFARGDDVLQKTHAYAMARHFRSNPAELESDVKYRLRFVISLAFAGEFSEASEIVMKYFGSDTDRKFRERLQERIRVIQLIARIAELPEGTDQDIEALGNELLAGSLTPYYASAVKRQLLRKGAARPALVELCRKVHAERKSTFDANDYVFWASILRQNQQNLEARDYLENAMKLDPNNDVAANNLANLLYKIEPVNLERALKFAEEVVGRNPNNFVYLETRGQILARLGRNIEAIDDLSRCLVSYPNIPEIHETLAACYRKTGETSLAKAHQSRFEELNSRKSNFPTKFTP